MDERYSPYPFAGGLIYLDVDESPMMRARAEGRFEPEKTAALQRLLKPGMTFVDVGANKGDFSLIAARVMNDEGRVLSFEPGPENCGWILKSIELNGYRSIKLHELALSDDEGFVPLYLGKHSGWHSLVPDAERGRSIEVEARTLDSVLAASGDAHADVLKIDVEGAELQVLRGAARTLAEQPPLAVLIDLHPSHGVDPAEVIGVLRGYGFSFRDPADLDAELPEPSPDALELFAVRP